MNPFAGKKKTALLRAARLFKERKFAQVIRILEPQIPAYRENAKYFYLLGMSCLYMGDYGAAITYLKRCVGLDYRNTNAQLGLAVVHLRRNETEESLRIWLEILDDNPQNRHARRGLQTVREIAGVEKEGEGFESLFDGRKDLALVPSPGFFLPSWAKVLVGIALAVFALVPAGLILKERLSQKSESARPEIASVMIETGDLVLDTGIRAVNMMTEQEVRLTFQKIKDLFDTFQDNLARREINRLLLSNAGQAVKNKVRAFIPFILTPTFADFSASFSYQEVMADPALHEGCFVRWKGRISNINISQNRINLDFLVGYEDQKVLQGIVPSWMEFAASLEQTFAYEVIGMVMLPETAGRPGIQLQIISLHELGL
ncbi:MAG: tetratricopeptide repeat protein [Spirochaetales bacterium]|jgi:tetratricopeptide (TPR) repeat protein|nr:tetratricopeptide repeat protein [Spirochaetales bacterium]